MEGNADLKILSVGWLGLDASDKNKQLQNWCTQQADFNSCTLPSIRQQMTEMKSTYTFNVHKLLTQGYAADPFSEFLYPKVKFRRERLGDGWHLMTILDENLVAWILSVPALLNSFGFQQYTLLMILFVILHVCKAMDWCVCWMLLNLEDRQVITQEHENMRSCWWWSRLPNNELLVPAAPSPLYAVSIAVTTQWSLSSQQLMDLFQQLMD